jgi:hypothetical protein
VKYREHKIAAHCRKAATGSAIATEHYASESRCVYRGCCSVEEVTKGRVSEFIAGGSGRLYEVELARYQHDGGDRNAKHRQQIV